MPKWVLVIVVGVSATFGMVGMLLSPEQPAAAQQVERKCPDLTKIRGICSVVYERLRAPENAGYRFAYEAYMRDAACATTSPLDSEDNMEKIRNLWARNPKAFQCNSSDFDVSEGSLIKYSISSRSMDFARSALKWKLDLNMIDTSDGRTPLDYLYVEMQRNKGSDMEPQLYQYVRAYRAAGAKFRCELPPTKTYFNAALKPILNGVPVCP